MISNWLEQINYNGITSGIESVASDNGMNISFISDTIHIYGNFESLALYNSSGCKVLESSEKHISTSLLTPGVYVARLNADARSVSKKILISK